MMTKALSLVKSDSLLYPIVNEVIVLLTNSVKYNILSISEVGTTSSTELIKTYSLRLKRKGNDIVMHGLRESVNNLQNNNYGELNLIEIGLRLHKKLLICIVKMFMKY